MLGKGYWIMLGSIILGGFLLMMFAPTPPVAPQLPAGVEVVPSDTTIVDSTMVITYKIVDETGIRP